MSEGTLTVPTKRWWIPYVVVPIIVALIGSLIGAIPLAIDRTKENLQTQYQAEIAQLEGEYNAEINAREQQIASIESQHQIELTQLEEGYKAEKAAQEQRLASIERRVGESTDLLDVSSLLISRDMVAEAVPDSSFFQEDHFYALQPDPSDGWIYEITTELGLLEKVGLDQDTLREALLPEQYDAFIKSSTLFPVHLWQKDEIHQIEGSPDYLAIFSHVLVQRMPHDSFPQLLGIYLDSEPAGENLSLPASGQDAQETLATLEDYYRGDAVGYFLTAQLQTELQGAQGAKVELTDIVKKGNVVYTKLITTLKDVIVDGNDYPEYYFVREFLLISTPDDLYVVKTLIPSPDLRSEDFAWINAWFGSFAIIE